MEPILYIGLSQAFFAGILVITKKPRLLSNQVLAAWFFLICIDYVIVLVDSTLIQLYSIKVLPFTYGPLLYLYASFITSEKPAFRASHLLHFIPFFAFFIVSLVFLNKPVMEGTKGFLITDKFISLRFIYGISFFVSVTTYSILTFIVINRYQREIKSILSFSSGKFTLQWLIGISVTFYVTYILMFIFGLIDILVSFMPFDPYELSFLGLTIFAFLFGYYGVNQPSIFSELHITSENNTNGVAGETSNDRKYLRSGLKKKDVNRYIESITNYMEKEKPYLDRELTILNVSKAIGIPRHFITEVINNYMGKNFYYLVNEYRIREVKERLKDPHYSNLTILAIAYDSGFNSKSSFNHIFKEMTGMTPSQYLSKRPDNDGSARKDNA